MGVACLSLSQCKGLYLILLNISTRYFRDLAFLHLAKTEVHVRQSTAVTSLNVFAQVASSENIATKVNTTSRYLAN